MHLCTMHAPMHFSLHSLRMHLCTSLCACPTHASLHFTVYALHSLLCMPLMHFISLGISLSTFPVYAFLCQLSLRMPLCIPSTCPARASMRFTVSMRVYIRACVYALHSVLALCMPLCISLSTLCMPPCVSRRRAHLCTSLHARPTHASLRLTVCSAHASLRFTVYFPCAFIYALHSALCVPLCFSLSTYPAECTSLCTCPAHASTHFTVYFPYACIYALHPVLTHACLSAFHSLLSLRMPLRTSLCTCPAHASMHFTDYSVRAYKYKFIQFTIYFPYACIYALHSVLVLCTPLCISLSTVRMPLCTSLCTCPGHASVNFPSASCIYALHSVLASMHFTVRSP